MNIHQADILADRFMFSSVNHALEKRVEFSGETTICSIRDQSILNLQVIN